MTTQASSITYDNSTDGLFQAWTSAFDSGITTVGMTAHAQAGEINFATVTKPAAANASQGFRVYKYNDGLTEAYMKVEFGSGDSGALEPALYFTWGRTLDGSGNFSGVDVSGRYRVKMASANAALGTVTTRFCMSGASFSINFNEALNGASPLQHVIVTDRTRNAGTGAANSTGLCIVAAGQNTALQRAGTGGTHWSEFLPVGSAGTVHIATGGGGRLLSAFPQTNGTYASGTDIGVFNVYALHGKPHVVVGACVVSPTDFLTGASVNPTIFGAAHVWRQTGLTSDGQSGGLYGRIAVIWE